jgi:hypothetical protein
MTSAFLGPIAPPQQQQLINDLKNDPKSVAHSLLTPHKVSNKYVDIDFSTIVLFYSLCTPVYDSYVKHCAHRLSYYICTRLFVCSSSVHRLITVRY